MLFVSVHWINVFNEFIAYFYFYRHVGLIKVKIL